MATKCRVLDRAFMVHISYSISIFILFKHVNYFNPLEKKNKVDQVKKGKCSIAKGGKDKKESILSGSHQWFKGGRYSLERQKMFGLREGSEV